MKSHHIIMTFAVIGLVGALGSTNIVTAMDNCEDNLIDTLIILSPPPQL